MAIFTRSGGCWFVFFFLLPVDAGAELLEEALVVLLGDVEHALHEGLTLRELQRGTSTSQCAYHLRPRAPTPLFASARMRPVRRRSNDGSRSSAAHRSASSSSTSSAALGRRDDAPEK